MRFICGWNAKLRVSKCGPKVQVTELKSHGYLVAFFMDESNAREPTFQRCWPTTKIQVDTRTNPKNGIKYHIDLPPSNFHKVDVLKQNSQHNPGLREEPEHKSLDQEHDIIPGCWEVSSRLLENWNMDRELWRSTYWMSLDADEFLKWAPKWVYSFTQNLKGYRVHYVPVTSAILAEIRDFKLEEDLFLPEIKLGESIYVIKRFEFVLVLL